MGFRFPKTTASWLELKLGVATDTCDIVREMIIGARKGGHLALIGDYFDVTNVSPALHSAAAACFPTTVAFSASVVRSCDAVQGYPIGAVSPRASMRAVHKSSCPGPHYPISLGCVRCAVHGEGADADGWTSQFLEPFTASFAAQSPRSSAASYRVSSCTVRSTGSTCCSSSWRESSIPHGSAACPPPHRCRCSLEQDGD